jgi:hypothetical protein
MEFKTMTLAELRGMDTTTMDEVEFAEWLRASAKANGTVIDAAKEQKLADSKADSEAMKVANESKTSKLVSKRSKDIKVSYTLKIDGSIENWTYGSAIRGAVAENSFKGVKFTIDGKTAEYPETTSNLNHGEFKADTLMEFATAKRVACFIGYAVRKNEFRADGVTKTAEASATNILKAFDEDEMARVAVVKDGETIALADYLASLE